jgi:chromosomal replication initiator protein
MFIKGDNMIIYKGFVYKKHKPVQATPDMIIDACCKYYGCTRDQISSSLQYRENGIIPARHLAMYMIRKINGLSLIEIANLFSKKDHSTAFNAIKKIETQMDLYDDLRIAFDTVLKTINDEIQKTNGGGDDIVFQREGSR